MAEVRSENQHGQEWPAFIAVYAAIAGLLGIVVGIYRIRSFDLDAIPGFALALIGFGFGIAVFSCLVLLREFRRARGATDEHVKLTVAGALFSVLLLLGAAEGTLWALRVVDDNGERLGSVALLPTWKWVRERNLRLIGEATPSGTWEEPYLVFHAELGWVVGANRTSADGMYMSSREGIRSGVQGEQFSDREPKRRIAILGDSNAFALEVPFEDSWGYFLEEDLGTDFQVLNFGVNGYGIDQAVMRYEIDIREWRPDVVILAFIQHNLTRSVVVYPFVSFPPWKMPFAKPRFVLDGGELFVVNTPLSDPERWFEYDDVSELPHISLDTGYRSALWSTRTDRYPLLIRLFTALFPRYPAAESQITDEQKISLNAALFNRFYETAILESIPFLVYLPTRGAGDFEEPRPANLAMKMLDRADLPYVDLTECLAGLSDDSRLVASGNHFSRTANRQIARCLAPLIRQSSL